MIAINVRRSHRTVTSMTVICIMVVIWNWARSGDSLPLAPTAVLGIDTRRPGNVFNPGAVGLSVEAKELSTEHLDATNHRLVRLMRLLGMSLLRIGGDSVDFSWWTSRGERAPQWATNVITPTDLLTLRKLLRATGWRVLLGVDLAHYEPARIADEARYAQNILGVDLVGIEIGNEPNGYSSKRENLRMPTYGVSEYLGQVTGYRDALEAAVPNIGVYGPALTQKTPWLTKIGTAARVFTVITQHYYPTITCPSTAVSEIVHRPTIPELLSPEARRQEDETISMLASSRAVAGRPAWIDETGTGPCDGSSYGSPAFASALWALDWTLRAASSGVKILNFHGQLGGVCGTYTQSPICAPSAEAAKAGDITPRPEYYGLLAASRLEGGRFVPTSLHAQDPLPNLTTWATVGRDGTLKIVIVDLATTGLAQPISILISGYAASEEILFGASADAMSGVTLGSVSITSDGQWYPQSTKPSRTRHSLRLVVRPHEAVIVVLRRNRRQD